MVLLENKELLVGIVIILVLFIIIWWITQRSVTNVFLDQMLEGIWVSSDTFEKTAEIDKMILYIGKEVKGTRNGYLLMQINGEVVENTKLEMKFSGVKQEDDNYTYYVKILNTDLDTLPNNLILKMNFKNGACSLHDNSTLFGEFFKDNQLSMVAEGVDDSNAVSTNKNNADDSESL